MKPNARLIMTGLFSGLFLAALDQTIVATALPTIIKDLQGIQLYGWVAAIYLLSSTVSLPVFGRMVELYDSKKILLWAIAIFLAGSILSGISNSMVFLIGARGIQGIGAGGLFSITLAVVGIIFTPRERGKYQGYFGAVFGISSILGPLLGGFLTDTLSWHWVFFINVPIGIGSLFFIFRYMPSLKPEKTGNLDIRGAILMILWTTPLLLALSWAGNRFAWVSIEILSLFGFSALTLLLFIILELRSSEPLFDFRLLSNTTIRRTSLALLFFGAVFISTILFLPLYLVRVKGISNTRSGLALLPLTLGVVIASTLSGRLVSYIGRYKPVLVISNSWLLIWLLVFSIYLSPTASLTWIYTAMFLIGLGMGPAMPLFTVAVQNAVTRERIGTASSASQFFRQIGSSIGAAIMGGVLAANLKGFGIVNNTGLAGAGGNLPEKAMANAITRSISEIYRASAVLVAISLLLTVLLPDIVLKGKTEKRHI